MESQSLSSHGCRIPTRIAVWMLGLLLATSAASAASTSMRMHFIDVGQGDATLVEFPCAAVLVDTGGEQGGGYDGEEALIAYLDRFFDARPHLNRTLALLAITHPHKDHTLGVRAVLDRYTVENAIYNGKRNGSGWSFKNAGKDGGQEYLDRQAGALGIPHRAVRFDTVSDVTPLHDAVIDPIDCRPPGSGPVPVPELFDPKITVLWGELGDDPGWGYKSCKDKDGKPKKCYHHDNGNNHSLALRFDYGKASLLLTGDLETHAIEEMVRHYHGADWLDVDVYQAGHHGSHNGGTSALLRAMSPKLAVLSMGPSTRECSWWQRTRNRCFTAWQHGHPRRGVVEDLDRAVTLRRRVPMTVQVADGQHTFSPLEIEKCIYATGWGGSVIIAARGADGWLTVEQPLGQACGQPPPDLSSTPSITSPAATAMAAAAQPAEAMGDARPDASEALKTLAARPLCEASAALIAPWDDRVALVADNELSRQLFAFTLEDEPGKPRRMEATVTMAMPSGTRPRDLEALARVGEAILAVGSFSRNSGCEEKTNRQRMRLLGSRSDGSLEELRSIDGEETWQKARRGEAECLEALFEQPAPALAPDTCQALLRAEEMAESGDGCPVLNIEGAFGTDDGRVWLGLRAPLVERQGALLRLTSELNDLRFDRVVLLDLEGQGIRELAREAGTVYGIAGPPEDATTPFALFSVPFGDLTGGGRLPPTILSRDLPTSSEGMLIHQGWAWVTVDGDEGEEVCKEPSKQYQIELPGV